MIDTVVVGAGPSGLCAAKTILQCDPHAGLVILDEGRTVGGVWSKAKLYDGLRTNHHFGGLDFSDFPMPPGCGGMVECQPGQHIPGEAVHEYLSSYARHWQLENKIQFNTKVIEATRLANASGWELKLLTPEESTLQCRKLIVAIGVNNLPHRPLLDNATDFDRPILHSSEIGTGSDSVFGADHVKTVAVLGGGKSAYDAVHAAYTAGKEVEWIIRKSGKGPVWVFPLLTKLGPFEAQRDRLPVRRIISFFSPCIWNDGFKWIRDLLHRTWIGKFVVQKFWAQLHVDTLRDCGFRKHEKTKLLEPEQSPYWYGTTAGACSYGSELLEHIHKGQIRIHRQDIDHLSEKTIHLSDETQLNADLLITATGYSAKPTLMFNPPELHSELGIPTTTLSKVQQEFWTKYDQRSDLRIISDFPELVAGPPTPRSHRQTEENKNTTSPLPLPEPHLALPDPEANYSPSRLYRSIAPPGPTTHGDHTLVFLGVFSNFANIARLEIQCLWAYAYLNHKLPALVATIANDPKAIYQEASMLSRYSRHRTPYGHGRYFPDHVFDQLPYFDVLMRDLGLKTRRKSGLWAELFEPYEAKDYRGLVDEWLAKNRGVGVKA